MQLEKIPSDQMSNQELVALMEALMMSSDVLCTRINVLEGAGEEWFEGLWDGINCSLEDIYEELSMRNADAASLRGITLYLAKFGTSTNELLSMAGLICGKATEAMEAEKGGVMLCERSARFKPVQQSS